MKNYTFYLPIEGYRMIEVKAENLQEASDKFDAKDYHLQSQWIDDINGIGEVEMVCDENHINITEEYEDGFKVRATPSACPPKHK